MADSFQVETQQKHNWCWAAVSVSVNRYFSPQSTWTQCLLAGKLLNAECCEDPAACDQVENLEAALAAAGLTVDVHRGRLLFNEIKVQIDCGRPVCCRIGWFDGGGHFVVISGYRESPSAEKQLFISDPYYADSIVDYDEFVSAYQGGGQWTGTFLIARTQP